MGKNMKIKKIRNILLVVFAMLVFAGAAVTIPPAGAVRVPILMYHSVTTDPKKAGKYTVTAAEFESDMEYIEKNGFTTVFISDLVNYEEKGTPLPKKPVVVTLDDGYEDNLTNVLPILQKLGMKATISIVGAFSTGDNRNFLNLDDIRKLVDSGCVEIGSHTYDMHYNQAGKRRGCWRKFGESLADYKAALTEDFTKNQTLLSENCGVTPEVFTYPYGMVSRTAKKVVKALGFKASLGVCPGMNYLTGNPEELFCMHRYGRPSGVDTAKFMKRLG